LPGFLSEDEAVALQILSLKGCLLLSIPSGGLAPERALTRNGGDSAPARNDATTYGFVNSGDLRYRL